MTVNKVTDEHSGKAVFALDFAYLGMLLSQAEQLPWYGKFFPSECLDTKQFKINSLLSFSYQPFTCEERKHLEELSLNRAVVVARLAELSPLIPEIRGSNLNC